MGLIDDFRVYNYRLIKADIDIISNYNTNYYGEKSNKSI